MTLPCVSNINLRFKSLFPSCNYQIIIIIIINSKKKSSLKVKIKKIKNKQQHNCIEIPLFGWLLSYTLVSMLAQLLAIEYMCDLVRPSMVFIVRKSI